MFVVWPKRPTGQAIALTGVEFVKCQETPQFAWRRLKGQSFAQFQRALGLDAAPQLLIRFGYAAAMFRSLRRPVEQVIRQEG